MTAIRAGAHGYLLKDESELSLANSIELVMQGQYPISPSFARYLFRLAGAPVAKTTSSNLMVSPRELELLQFISQGSTYSHCADLMNISLSTVQSHIRNMYRKLEVTNNRQAISKAQAVGLMRL